MSPGRCRGLKVEKNLVPMRTLPIHVFRHFCYRMCHLTTIQSVTEKQTDRQTDSRHYHANSRSYGVQCDWLKIELIDQ